jgi:hypothetical protein
MMVGNMQAFKCSFVINTKINFTACEAAGKTRGTKDAMLAHLISGTARKFQNASDAAVNMALSVKYPGEKIVIQTVAAGSKHARSSRNASHSEQLQKKMKQAQISPHVFKGLDIPFNAAQTAVIQAQCLHAVISTNSSFSFFEDPEVVELLKMMRTAAPAILPSGKCIGGKLLNDASGVIEVELEGILQGQMIRLVNDRWKGARKEKLDGVCANVDYKVRSQVYLPVLNQRLTSSSGPGSLTHLSLMTQPLETKTGRVWLITLRRSLTVWRKKTIVQSFTLLQTPMVVQRRGG